MIAANQGILWDIFLEKGQIVWRPIKPSNVDEYLDSILEKDSVFCSFYIKHPLEERREK